MVGQISLDHALSWQQDQDGDPALGFSTKSSSITRTLQVALDLRIPFGSGKCNEGFAQGRLGVRSGRHMEMDVLEDVVAVLI